MSAFYSPLKLIKLLKDSRSIAEELEERNVDWYFSRKGEKAYNEAKTPAQKTIYFFNYLIAVSKLEKEENKYSLPPDKECDRKSLYYCAYVMANSMDSSSLEFAGYPNILKPEKNPLVDYIKSNGIPDSGAAVLAALNHEKDEKKYVEPEFKPYSRLTYCNPDGSVNDKYKIERDIIGTFYAGRSGHMPPYIYEMYCDDEEQD